MLWFLVRGLATIAAPPTDQIVPFRCHKSDPRCWGAQTMNDCATLWAEIKSSILFALTPARCRLSAVHAAPSLQSRRPCGFRLAGVIARDRAVAFDAWR